MAPTNSTSPPTDPAWTIDPNRDCTCAPRNRHREDSEMPAPPFRRTDDGCRKSEPQPQLIVCRRDNNRSVRSLNRRRRRPDARCPDDPSENSALPFRSTWPLCVRYRSPYFRMSRHYVPKNLHNAWIRCHRVCTPRSLYRRKVRYNTTPIPVNMNRRQVN